MSLELPVSILLLSGITVLEEALIQTGGEEKPTKRGRPGPGGSTEVSKDTKIWIELAKY